MRRTALLAAAATLLGSLAAAPAAHAEGPYGQGLDHCAPAADGTLACHFDVAPGTYDVSVVLGGAEAGFTAVTGETRRALLAETATGAGQYVRRSFTVDVRDPEGEPTGAAGSPASTSSSAAPPRAWPRSGSPPPPGPNGSSSSATPPSATSRATPTPAGARCFRPI